ncbi:MAG: hypothetical protein K6G10_09930, partial [Butyrivibrio sp.]|nr:hypothetical protein [Butyrivibrio sp.]
EVSGTYRVIGSGYDIKSATVTNKAGKKITLSFNNTVPVIPLKKTDLKVTLKIGKKKVVLEDDDYEIESVKNNKFLGTMTVVIRGVGKYGGTKSFTVKITSKNM